MLETKQGKITVEELFDMELEEGYFYELINGNIVKKQAPSPLHQEAVGNIHVAFHTFIKEKQIGKCYTAPIDVFFDKYNNTQPDILFIKKDRQFIVTKHGIEGHPDLIVEVLSPSSFKNDRISKKALYLQFGVSEYWIVDPIYQSVEVFNLENGIYELKHFIVESGEVESKILEGFKMDIKNIFEAQNTPEISDSTEGVQNDA
jgi:Uma2 family endonuclease